MNPLINEYAKPYTKDPHVYAKWIAASLPSDAEYYFVTLTEKQKYCGRGGQDSLATRDRSDQNVAWFLRRLNRKIFGNAARKYGKSLRVIDCSEGGPEETHYIRGQRLRTYRRFHRHLLMEKPNWMSEAKFQNILLNEWHRSDWSYQVEKIEAARSVEAVTKYILKQGPTSLSPATTTL